MLSKSHYLVFQSIRLWSKNSNLDLFLAGNRLIGYVLYFYTYSTWWQFHKQLSIAIYLYIQIHIYSYEAFFKPLYSSF
jgi:hypothetical protein